ADGILHRDPAAAHAHRAQLETTDIEDVERDQMPLPCFTQQIFDRNSAVIQDDGAGRRTTNSHLVFFGANREPWESLFYEEGGKLFSVDFGEDREQVSKASVRDPHFLAVQDVVLAIWRDGCACAAVQGIG